MTRALALAALLTLAGCGMTESDSPWAELEGNWVSSQAITAKGTLISPAYEGPFFLRLSIDDSGTGAWSWGGWSSTVLGQVVTDRGFSLTLFGETDHKVLVTATLQGGRLVGTVSGSPSQWNTFEGVPVTLVRGN
jgi:hypothetical protein